MKKLTILTFILSVLSLVINAQIINIPADYPSIQEGIDAASDGDTVLVQPGTYVEQINYNGKNILVASLFLTTGDESYIKQTIIDGDAYGLPCVRFVSGESDEAKIIGLTVQNGFVGSDNFGGGIYLTSNACPIIDHMIIKNNNAQNGYGAGISTYYAGHAVVSNTIFENNLSSEWGAIYLFATYLNIINCEFRNNEAPLATIGLFRASATIQNTIIHSNNTNNAAIRLHEGCQEVHIINSTISNNNSSIGIRNTASTIPKMINSIVSGHEEYNIKIESGGPFCIDHSIIEGGEESIDLVYPDQLQYGENNIDSSPGFIDPEHNDYRLSDCSPGLGSGISSLIMVEDTLVAPNYDIENNFRPNPTGTNLDIGAYESELWIPNIPVTITTQPVGKNLCEGESYTFSVQAEGSLEISYQWQKDEVNIPRENNSTLTLNNIVPDEQGYYTCVLSTSCGTLISDTAYLRVFSAPSIIQQPRDIFAYEGDSVAFVPMVSGYEPLSYQWYGPDGILPGETSQYLQFPEIHFSDTGNYFCTVENTCASFQSENAHISVFQQLVADAGEDKYIHPMYSATLNANIQGGSQGIEYFWSPDTLVTDPFAMNTQTIPLSTSQTLTFTVIDTIVGYQASDTMSVIVVWNDTTNINGFGNDTIYHFENGQQPCGYISGNNCDNDLIKAQYFYDDLNLFEINEILIHFYKAIKTSEEEVPVRVGIWDNTGNNNTPGAIVTSINIPLSEIVENTMNNDYSNVSFEEPVSVGNGFYVGVFLPQSEGDTVVISTNLDGQSEPNLAWTQKADFEWISYSLDPRWYLNVSNAIFPVVKQVNLGFDDTLFPDKEYRVFPNPASDRVSIVAQKPIPNKSEIILYTTQGDEVNRTEFTSNVSIPVGDLIPGIYILLIKNSNHTETHKIVVI